MKKIVPHLTPIGVVVLAVFFLFDGVYIHCKAALAQHLLQRAWQKSVEMHVPVKPWPWADTWPVARLKVSRLGIDCIVLEGDSGEVLAFGPGHISESTKPVASGNCALVGHRDTSFVFLRDLERGDVIELQNVSDEKRSYQVVSTEVSNGDDLFLEETVTPWLTLITCYPFNALTSVSEMRFVVFAREVKGETGLIANSDF